jgi:hypothetical protein
MTPEEIKQAVANGYLSEDTANYMLSQNASTAQQMPPPPAPMPPPDLPPPDMGSGGAGGAGPVGDRFINTRNGDLGAGGAPPVFGGQGGAAPMYSSPGGGSSGPPVSAPNAPISPPLQPAFQPSRTVDPGALVMNRPPPVTGEKPAPPQRPAGGGGMAGPGAKNPLTGYSQATMANFDEQKRNLENRRDFEMVNASMRAAQMQEDERGLSAQDEQRAMQHQQRLQKSDAALADLNARADALSRGKIDPGRWISDDPMHALAAVFIGMDSPVVQKMIDRDIQSQKDAYDRNKDSYLARASNYGHLRELYKDEDMAEAAARVMQVDRAQRKLNVMTASQQPQDINLKTQEAMTTLAQVREDADYKFKAAAYNAQVKTGGATEMPEVFRKVFGKDTKKFKEAQQEYFSRNPKGNMLGFASEVAQATKGGYGATGVGVRGGAGLYAQEVNAKTVESEAQELARLQKEYSLAGAVLHPVETARLEARMDKLRQNVTLGGARVVHGGVASDREIEAEGQGLGGWGEYWDPTGSRQARLKVIEEDARKRRDELSKGLKMGYGAAANDEGEDEGAEEGRRR